MAATKRKASEAGLDRDGGLSKAEPDLPEPLCSPNTSRIAPGRTNTVVAFDIEGTGLLHENGELVELAAVYKGEDGAELRFDMHVLPAAGFSPEAGRITGFSVRDGQLYRRGGKVDTVSLEACLSAFTAWLRDTPHPPVLMAHNGFCYDSPLLCAGLHDCGLFPEFHEALRGGGCGDSLTLVRQLYPRVGKHSMDALKGSLLAGKGKTYEAHNGVDDARALLHILQLPRVRPDHVLQHAEKVEPGYGEYSRKFVDNVRSNRPSLDGIYMLSNVVKTKLGGVGYNLERLRAVARRSGRAGITAIYRHELDIKSHDERHIDKIYSYVS